MNANRDTAAGAETATRTVEAILLAAAVGIAFPGLVAGMAIALGMRAMRLRWTWGLWIASALALPVVVAPSERVDAIRVAVARAANTRTVDFVSACRVLWPWWLVVAGAGAVVSKRLLERRALLHGGEGERALERELGPIAMAAQIVRRIRARREPMGASRGTWLGTSRLGEPVVVPALRTHAMIVGGSGTGKTTTAEVLLEGEVAAGRGFVVLDGKGGRGLPTFAVELAARFERPVALWSVLPYGDSALDERRRAWNPAGGGNPTEIKDRIAAAEEQTEPYYAAIAARGLLCAVRATAQTLGGDPGLSELVELLDAPAQLAARLSSLDPEHYAREIRWLSGLTDTERSGLRGMASRLDTMISSDGGEWLLPDSDVGDIDLYRAVSEGWLVVFSLPEGTYPALIPHVCRYALAALNAVATRLEREGRDARSVVFVDELSAFDGDQLCGGLERGRSAGMSYVVATQSVSNFRTAGGEKLIDAIFDNSELLIIHRQSSPRAVEELASLGGTADAWEHTHSVDDHGRTAFGDETGNRTRRLAQQFRAHPNTIRRLGVGEAVVIRNRSEFTVEEIRVNARPAASAEMVSPETLD